MISFGELRQAISGVVLLARFNPQGLTHFDNNVKAFWRSYWSAIFALPLYIALVLMRTPDSVILVGYLSTVIIYGTSYVLGWFTMPFAMFYVCRVIDREDRFFQYFVAYNWATLIQIGFMVLIIIGIQSGIFPKESGGIFIFITISIILLYQGYIARIALMISRFGACGVILLDLTIGVMIESWAANLLLGQNIFGG
ncbi:MAG: hypothetical protein VX434_08855 [Pseudomonadota bacterium]|nr:hypothetical protein [Pseudomonadota bacterium]